MGLFKETHIIEAGFYGRWASSRAYPPVPWVEKLSLLDWVVTFLVVYSSSSKHWNCQINYIFTASVLAQIVGSGICQLHGCLFGLEYRKDFNICLNRRHLEYCIRNKRRTIFRMHPNKQNMRNKKSSRRNHRNVENRKWRIFSNSM